MTIKNRWLVLTILSSALFLIVIDMTVLYTALPRLTHDLAATASEKLWIINAYPLVVAGLLPGLGTLGDRFGHKPLFIYGLGVFGAASLLAAYAPVPAVLVGARVLLAVGAAMMMPATLSIIRLTFEDERERSFAIGIWAAIASGGAAIGPVLGGFLLEYFWWGSVFLINVPVVLIALALAVRVIPDRPANTERPWDLIGSVQILVGLIGIAYAIKEASKRAPSWEAVALAAIIGIIALTLFVHRQNRLPHKLIDFSLFRDTRFSSGVATALIASLALIGLELAISQRLQLVLGLSPLEAGLFIIPIPLAAFLAGPLTGLLMPRIGGINILWSSMLVAGAGLAFYLTVHNASLGAQIAGFVILGFGIGAGMTAASSVIMLSAPADRAGMAASIEEVSYELGGAIGIAILGSIMSAVYSLSLVLPESMAVSEMAYDSLDEALIIAEKMTGEAAALLRHQTHQAFDRAFIVVSVIASALLLLTGIAVWLGTRKRRTLLA
ncbi:MFS transporter [Reyranella sp.]|uniref:MFS transporter n=1 Tax=Reyranella sp. TaxID=1929291 RepID=UPI001229D9F2|nr:MFS transporter [Reyranella sp.]TAJ89845.1 MAG: MFS transporter [Reyranella sp.]